MARASWLPSSRRVDGLVEPGVRVRAQRLYLADVAAVVGIIVEKPAIYPVIALVLGMFSFYIFVGADRRNVLSLVPIAQIPSNFDPSADSGKK
jgi:hypothetical protein